MIYDDDARPLWLCITEQWRIAERSPKGSVASQGGGGRPRKPKPPKKPKPAPEPKPPKPKPAPLVKVMEVKVAKPPRKVSGKPRRTRFVGPPKPKDIPSPSHTKEARKEYQRRWLESLTDEERKAAWRRQYARRDKLRLKAYYWAYHQAHKRR